MGNPRAGREARFDQWTTNKNESVTVEKPSTLMDVHGFVSGASASYVLDILGGECR